LAAKNLSSGALSPDDAVICSKELMDFFGLTIVAEDISNIKKQPYYIYII